jgi:beta-fructofuranosidase
MTGERSAAGSPENDFAHALLENVNSDCFEITATITLNGAKKAGILVRCDEDLADDVTGIYVCGQTRSVYVEDLRAGFEAPRARLWDAFYDSPSLSVSMPVLEGTDGRVTLRVIVDVSVVEVFINGRACLTGRCYPKGAASLSAGLFTVSGGAVFDGVRVWELGL